MIEALEPINLPTALRQRIDQYQRLSNTPSREAAIVALLTRGLLDYYDSQNPASSIELIRLGVEADLMLERILAKKEGKDGR